MKLAPSIATPQTHRKAKPATTPARAVRIGDA